MSSSYSHSKAGQFEEQQEVLEQECAQSKFKRKTGTYKAAAPLYVLLF